MWVIQIRTESGDEYLKLFKVKPSIKKLSLVMFKHLGYDSAKELENHFVSGIHALVMEKHKVIE